MSQCDVRQAGYNSLFRLNHRWFPEVYCVYVCVCVCVCVRVCLSLSPWDWHRNGSRVSCQGQIAASVSCLVCVFLGWTPSACLNALKFIQNIYCSFPMLKQDRSPDPTRFNLQLLVSGRPLTAASTTHSKLCHTVGRSFPWSLLL